MAYANEQADEIAALRRERDEAVALLKRGIHHAEKLEAKLQRAREAGMAMTDSAAAYMEYHTEKFYPDYPETVIGLWPAIKACRKALADLDEGGDAHE